MTRVNLRAAALTFAGPLAVGLLAMLVLPGYWLYLATAALVTATTLLSLGVVEGRTGMISLCQLSFAGVGAWTVGYLNLADAPGGLPVWIVIGGLAAVPFGVAIGLPALRLRGINLAIVTLGFAVAFDAVLASITFPGQAEFRQVARPAAFDSDPGYFLFVLLAFAIVAGGVELLSGTRIASAWLTIRHSERAAATQGVSIPFAKLQAFAISAFIAGVSGGLLAGYLGALVSDNFTMFGSLSLYAVATMVGAEYVEGAIMGGLLVALFPELLRRLDLPQDLGNVLFAAGAVQALASGQPIGAGLRRALAKLGRTKTIAQTSFDREALPPAVDHGRATALQVRGLTVRYGAVSALRSVDLEVPAGAVVGLIGPNGAGKSTFIDTVTGFVRNYGGEIATAGRSMDHVPPHRRVRMGVRRTWQTNRIAPDLSVAAYLRLAAPGIALTEIAALAAWMGCPDPESKVSEIDAGSRRLLDVAGAVAARPIVLLLDEPAAGQSFDEARRLADRVAEIPKLFGSSVLLVEHDMDLIRACCSAVTVLDFGEVIASGPTEHVLGLPAVRAAYLGVDQVEVA